MPYDMTYLNYKIQKYNEILKMYEKMLDKSEKVCYNKDTK